MAMETCIDYIHGENTIIWSTNHFATVRKMEELIEKYPDEVQIVRDFRNEDGEAKQLEIKIPAKWMRMPKPPRKKELTEEQRQAAGERFRKYHAEKRAQKLAEENEDDD